MLGGLVPVAGTGETDSVRACVLLIIRAYDVNPVLTFPA
jgi:hypothetical protein